MAASPSDIALLYRRAGFGARPDEIAKGVSDGYEATVEHLLDRAARDNADDLKVPNTIPTDYGPTPNAAQRTLLQQEVNAQTNQLVIWWLDRMVASSTPLREKLSWYWHGHFATSNEKVGSPGLMLMQNETFRKMGGGNFEGLVQAMAKDPAMMVWLDSNTNRKGRPNENFSRELMELFTIGIGNYTDADVREGARAFTGWTVDRAAQAIRLNRDTEDLDQKTFLGQTGILRAEDVVNILIRQPASHRYVAARVWGRFVHPISYENDITKELAGKFSSDLDVTNLMRNVFLHPQFRSAKTRTELVKEPVEWLVGALRAFGLTASRMQTGNPTVLNTLNLLGQMPFSPPSVGGWPQNRYWLSSQTSLARLRFAEAVGRSADLSWLASLQPGQRADALAARLGVDRWTRQTGVALTASITNPAALATLALTSPEFVLN